MKWLIFVILMLAGSAFADEGPATLKFKNGVTFPHKKHQGYMKSECKQCHKKANAEPGKIEGFGKDAAHRLCRTCHAMKKAGPSACPDCHKKQ